MFSISHEPIFEKLGGAPFILGGPACWEVNNVGQTVWYPSTLVVYNDKYVLVTFFCCSFFILDMSFISRFHPFTVNPCVFIHSHLSTLQPLRLLQVPILSNKKAMSMPY